MRKAIVRIFNPAVVSLAGDAIDIEKVDLPEIDQELLEQFTTRLLAYDYEQSVGKNGIIKFKCTKTKSWSLEVVVTNSEISFTCPGTKQSISTLLFESFQTASELCDHDRLAVLDCSREKRWMNLEHLKT